MQQSTRLTPLHLEQKRKQQRVREDRRRGEPMGQRQRPVLLSTALLTIHVKMLVSSEALPKCFSSTLFSYPHQSQLYVWYSQVHSTQTEHGLKHLGHRAWKTEPQDRREIYMVNCLSRSSSWDPEENVHPARWRNPGRHQISPQYMEGRFRDN